MNDCLPRNNRLFVVLCIIIVACTAVFCSCGIERESPETSITSAPTITSEPSVIDTAQTTTGSVSERDLQKDLFLRLCDILSDEAYSALLKDGDYEDLAERYSASYMIFMNMTGQSLYPVREINVVEFPPIEAQVPSFVDFAVEFTDEMNNRYVVAVSAPYDLYGFEAFYKNGVMIDMHYIIM